ncbi:hypothetical protein BJ165DRAFT_1397369 [Panaeolus papilionaceus]|nr:hypothetical protein BJ165DRAFT_1397369 [Panaeolus papilionaceus]
MATSLPAELWHTIISHLSPSSPSPTSLSFPSSPHSQPPPLLTSTLLSLALTCSTLTPLAQSHLFSSLTPSPSHQRSAHRAIARTFEEKPWLAQCVRVMSVGMPTAYKSGVVDAKALVGILNRLQNLEVLRIESSFSLCNFSLCIQDRDIQDVLRAVRGVLRGGSVRSVVVSQMNDFDIWLLEGCTAVRRVVLSECRLGLCTALELMWLEDDLEMARKDEADGEKISSQTRSDLEKEPEILCPTHLVLSSQNLEYLVQFGFIASPTDKEDSDPGYSSSPSSSASSSASSSPSPSLSPSPPPSPPRLTSTPLLSLSLLTSLTLTIPPSSSLSPTTLTTIFSPHPNSTLMQGLEHLEIRVGLLDFHNQPWSTLDSLLSSSISLSPSSSSSSLSSPSHTPTPKLKTLRIHILPDSAGWCYDMDIATAHLEVRFEGLRACGVRVEVLGEVCETLA